MQQECYSAQLLGLEGWRVEVITTYGEKRRFIVGRNTVSAPMRIHLELAKRNSIGGNAADRDYASVRKLYKVR